MLSNIGYFLRRLWWSFFAKGAPLTVGIVIANVIIYTLELVWAWQLQSSKIVETFALSPNGLNHRHYWQPLTYAWLHDQQKPQHLLLNMLGVGFFGRLLEWPLGPIRFTVLYLGSSLGAAVAWLYFDQPTGHDAIIGASGAAFALMVAAAVFEPKRRLLSSVLPFKLTTGRLALLLVLSEIFLWHFDLVPQITHAAHLGGAVFGFFIMKFWKVEAGTTYPIDGPISRL